MVQVGMLKVAAMQQELRCTQEGGGEEVAEEVPQLRPAHQGRADARVPTEFTRRLQRGEATTRRQEAKYTRGVFTPPPTRETCIGAPRVEPPVHK